MTSPGHMEAGPGLLASSNRCPRAQSKSLLLGSNTSIPLKCALQDVQGRHRGPAVPGQGTLVPNKGHFGPAQARSDSRGAEKGGAGHLSPKKGAPGVLRSLQRMTKGAGMPGSSRMQAGGTYPVQPISPVGRKGG